jgi:hypothetical protein
LEKRGLEQRSDPGYEISVPSDILVLEERDVLVCLLVDDLVDLNLKRNRQGFHEVQ